MTEEKKKEKNKKSGSFMFKGQQLAAEEPGLKGDVLMPTPWSDHSLAGAAGASGAA